MNWNSSGFTKILFLMNHSMVTLNSDCNSSVKSSTVEEKNISHCHMQNYELMQLKYKKKLLKNRLNNVGPNADPCGTPGKTCLKLLVVLSIQTHCFF